MLKSENFQANFNMNFLRYKPCPEYGDTVIVYLGISNFYALKLESGKVFQTKYGALKHDDVIGKPYGSTVNCSKGWVYILFPTPELWTLTLPHRTQILYTPDISFITLQLDLKPGCVVCEAGTGSGSLSHAIARTIGEEGHLYTYDFHEHRVQVAQQEFKDHGLEHVITSQHRDVCRDGFDVQGVADAVFLDLPNPWEVVQAAAKALKTKGGGRLCSFSPCMEQVQRTCRELESRGFVDITTWECLERPLEVRQVTLPAVTPDNRSQKGGSDRKQSSSPDSVPEMNRKRTASSKNDEDGHTFYTALPRFEMTGHTGYLTFATLLPRRRSTTAAVSGDS